MSDTPLRLRVQMALTQVFESIHPGNQYTHDLRGKVFRGRLMFGDSDPLPLVSILETPIAPDQLPQPVDSTVSNGEWDLLIQGFVEDDKAHPTDPAHYLMAEVKQALAIAREKPEVDRQKTGEASHLLGIKEVTRLQIGAGTVRPADEISATAYFWLNITLGLAEDLLSPYEDS